MSTFLLSMSGDHEWIFILAGIVGLYFAIKLAVKHALSELKKEGKL